MFKPRLVQDSCVVGTKIRVDSETYFQEHMSESSPILCKERADRPALELIIAFPAIFRVLQQTFAVLAGQSV